MKPDADLVRRQIRDRILKPPQADASSAARTRNAPSFAKVMVSGSGSSMLVIIPAVRRMGGAKAIPVNCSVDR